MNLDYQSRRVKYPQLSSIRYSQLTVIDTLNTITCRYNYIDLKVQYIFTTLAFESFVAVGPETTFFLWKLGKLMARNSLDYFMQRISIAIQRGNSIFVRDTFCDFSYNNDCNVFS